MNQYQELYKKKRMSAEQALELIQDGDSMFSAQAAAEPQAILSRLQHLKETGVKGTTLNSCLPIQYYDAMKDPEMAGIMSHNGWFFTAGLRDAQKKKLVSAVPQSSTSVLRKSLQRLQAEGRRPVVLATVSPMDSHGYFSLSVSAIYERDLIRVRWFCWRSTPTFRAPLVIHRYIFPRWMPLWSPTALSPPSPWCPTPR